MNYPFFIVFAKLPMNEFTTFTTKSKANNRCAYFKKIITYEIMLRIMFW